MATATDSVKLGTELKFGNKIFGSCGMNFDILGTDRIGSVQCSDFRLVCCRSWVQISAGDVKNFLHTIISPLI